jgi:pyruvate/2-oxoglutarate/acetoin dehydrogenase E1 component
MYNNQVRVPLLIRTPMGGRRGYGPTHSQSTEKHLLGIPGLRVLAPNALCDPKQLIVNSILTGCDPVLFVEHKLLYLCKLNAVQNHPGLCVSVSGDSPANQFATVRVAGAPAPQLTIAAYGYSAELVFDALWRLAVQREIFAEAIVPTRLSPIDISPILYSVLQTSRLLTVEEGTAPLGWGSEIVSMVIEAAPVSLRLAARRVAAREGCIPTSRPLEDKALPGSEDIYDKAVSLVAEV